jgi:integrase
MLSPSVPWQRGVPPGHRLAEPFTLEQLKTIFGAPEYAPGAKRDGQFWFPLIALFSGLRLNEIAQLAADDVAERDGVPVILVRPDPDAGKRVKSKAAVRVVPIHPELVRIGFLDHAAKIKEAGQARLFPDLRKAATGYYSDVLQKRFSRFLRRIGAAGARTISTHSATPSAMP